MKRPEFLPQRAQRGGAATKRGRPKDKNKTGSFNQGIQKYTEQAGV
jgi:hypothetical protein